MLEVCDAVTAAHLRVTERGYVLFHARYLASLGR